MVSKPKPKFRVGQVVFGQMGIGYVRLLKSESQVYNGVILHYWNWEREMGTIMRKDSDLEDLFRPLTKRERGK